MPEPIIDPVTGKPKEGNGGDPSAPQYVTPEQYSELKGRLDTFEKVFDLRGQQPQPAPQAPAAPQGPTLADQLAAVDRQIDAYDDKIDAAVKDGDPVSKLMRERDALNAKRLRMQIKSEDIDPAMASGINTINQLTDTVTRSSMPHLAIVQSDYEAALNQMPPDQRMSPQIRQMAYNLAVGQNIEKIMEAENERKLRESQDPPAPQPGSTSRANGGGGGGTEDGIPKPEDVLSRDTMKALRLKGQTVDDYYKARGYEGWKDFWGKTGKDYFEG